MPTAFAEKLAANQAPKKTEIITLILGRGYPQARVWPLGPLMSTTESGRKGKVASTTHFDDQSIIFSVNIIPVVLNLGIFHSTIASCNYDGLHSHKISLQNSPFGNLTLPSCTMFTSSSSLLSYPKFLNLQATDPVPLFFYRPNA